MDKQKVIQKSYGEYWDKVKDLVHPDGSIIASDWRDSGIENIPYKYYSTGYIRPLSLENNNGWIKIESEEDLPNKPDELFEVGILDSIGFFHHERKRYAGKSIKWLWSKDLITHYQPIQKLKPPIY